MSFSDLFEHVGVRHLAGSGSEVRRDDLVEFGCRDFTGAHSQPFDRALNDVGVNLHLASFQQRLIAFDGVLSANSTDHPLFMRLWNVLYETSERLLHLEQVSEIPA